LFQLLATYQVRQSKIYRRTAIKNTMKRTNTVQLIVDKESEDKLKELAITTAKCWNEVNWLRIQDYKNHRRRDFNETGKEVYHKYKKILKVNASQACIKNAEAWLSFFELTKEKKEGKLPKWFKPKPPNYWKEGDYKYRMIILIRNDRYSIDEENQEIYLKDFKLTLRFKGILKWRGKQGRLEIQYNKTRRRWYAYIPMEVEKVNKEKEKQKVKEKEKQEGLKASIDLGIVNLATVYVEDGTWYLSKGSSVLSEYEHYSKRIAIKQKILARHEQRRSISMLYDKRRRFLRHSLNSMVRRIMVLLKDKNVSDVIIGYPKDVSKNRGNKLTVNFWNYNYIIKRFKDIGKELGIKVITVNEGNTSKTCCLCKEVHDNGRVKRGLYKCPCIGNVINADLNGAVNILLHKHTHSPESLGTMDNNYKSITNNNNNKSIVMDRGLSMVRDRGKWLKTQPVVYRWMSRAGWVGDDELLSNHHLPTSNEVMKMKAVNHKPMIALKGTLTL
jgi:putative transposase